MSETVWAPGLGVGSTVQIVEAAVAAFGDPSSAKTAPRATGAALAPAVLISALSPRRFAAWTSRRLKYGQGGSPDSMGVKGSRLGDRRRSCGRVRPVERRHGVPFAGGDLLPVPERGPHRAVFPPNVQE